MLLNTPKAELASRLRSAFSALGYDEASLAERFGRIYPLRLTEPEKLDQAAGLEDAGPLGVLLRLFFLELSLAREEYERGLAAPLRRDLEATGLIQNVGQNIAAFCLLVPVEGCYIAGDRYAKLAPEGDVQHVLSVNPPARFLANMAVRRPVRRLLDLCAGNGIFSILLAPFADEVVATDLNPRAVTLARFNAALNGIENMKVLEGSGFEPVLEQRFEQIICNPPYIITPSRRFLCTDSDEELDGFCRSLLLQAPEFLQEDGILQMICEWVETSDEDWRTRVGSWVRGNGCDAWVICSGVSPIDDYAERRRAQTLQQMGPESVDPLTDWLDYFRARKVKAVRSGFVQLRKRKGENWLSFTSLADSVRVPVGDEIVRGFAQRDRYSGMPTNEILALCPLPAAGLSTLPGIQSGENKRLVARRGLPASLAATPGVVALLDRLDGRRPLEQISDELAHAAGVAPDGARIQCGEVARELLCQGLIIESELAVSSKIP